MKSTVFSHQNPCPTCSRNLNGATDAQGGQATPRPGDITICMYCTSVLKFDDSMLLKPCDFENEPLLTDESKARLRELRAFFAAKRPS